MWQWLNEKAQMPRFVWVGVLVILLALAYQILRANSLVINLQERSLAVARAEAEVAAKEQKVIEAADSTIAELERLKTEAPQPELREKFEVAQMALRDDVKNPLMKKEIPPHLEKFVRDLREAKK